VDGKATGETPVKEGFPKDTCKWERCGEILALAKGFVPLGHGRVKGCDGENSRECCGKDERREGVGARACEDAEKTEDGRVVSGSTVI